MSNTGKHCSPDAILIKGARLFSGTGEAGKPAEGATGDILIRDGRIAEIGSLTSQSDTHVIDADGLVALPGLVDMHVHLRQIGREDAETIESGSRAAAAGGFTAICAMANTTPTTDTAELAEHTYDLGRRVGLVDVQPIGAVTKGLAGKELAELGLMNTSRAKVTVFSDDGHCVADSRVMRRALDYIRPFNGVISQHSQDPDLAPWSACCHEGEISGRLGLPGWPTPAESSIIARDVTLAAHTNSRVHVAHVTTAEGLDVVRWGKKRGLKVTAEATPHHLVLTHDNVVGYDPVFKVNPPLRPREDTLALQEAVQDGTIDIIATDHAPHARQDKERAFVDAAHGMLGMETALSVISDLFVTSGRLTWDDVARLMSVNPARIAGLDGHGQALCEGSPGNVTLIDPDARRTVDREASQSISRNNPWHGMSFTGAVHTTILRGRITASEGAVLG